MFILLLLPSSHVPFAAVRSLTLGTLTQHPYLSVARINFGEGKEARAVSSYYSAQSILLNVKHAVRVI